MGLGSAGRPPVICRVLIAVGATLSLACAASTAPAASPPPPGAAPATRPATSPAEEERFRRGDALRQVLLELVDQSDKADGVWPERLPTSRPGERASEGP